MVFLKDFEDFASSILLIIGLNTVSKTRLDGLHVGVVNSLKGELDRDLVLLRHRD